MIEDQMFVWHHQLNGHESEQILRNNEGQDSLVCCSPRGHKESDMASKEQQFPDFMHVFIYI